MSSNLEPSSDPETLPPGTAVGDYDIESLIGAGGFARVYRARHRVVRAPVAIKVITRALALDADASERFVREARAAMRIAHPNVVRILGFGSLPDGRAYQVMELVEGSSLDHRIEEHVPSVEEALRILDAIALGLHAAHSAGIVHRDLKPSNVLIAQNGLPRLADFGIAKALEGDDDPRMTRTGVTLGTPAYMSPEQALGRHVGIASDIYAFGVVAFELLTGKVPFEGGSPFEIMLMHVQGDPPKVSALRPEIGTQFDDAIAAMLAKHAEERPQTIQRAMDGLRRSASAQPLAPRRRLRPWHLAAVALAIGAPLAIVASTHADAPETAPVMLDLREAPAPATAPAARAITYQPAPPPPPPRETPRTKVPPAAPPPPLPAGGRDSFETPPDYKEQ